MTVTATQVAALVQGEQAADAAALEEQAAVEADGGAAEALAVIAAGAAAAWLAKVGTWDMAQAGGTAVEVFLAGLRRQVTTALGGLSGRASAALTKVLTSAAELGQQHALAVAALLGRTGRRGAAHVPRDAARAAQDLAGDAARQIRLALSLLTPASVRRLGGFRGVLAAIGAARRALSMVRSRIAWAVHRTINAAAQGVADALGLGRLWVAEPAACPTCRAYSGRYAAAGADFPGGISLDPRQRSYFPEPLPGPPRHPNCRCRTIPWLPAFGTRLPNQLKAQARAA